MVIHVKQNCEDSTKSLVHEVRGRFLNHKLMLVLVMIYPNFRVDHLIDVKGFFHYTCALSSWLPIVGFQRLEEMGSK